MFVAFVRHMDAATWLECHVRAFTFFGSVPRRIILDNLKSGVLHPDLYDPLLNRGYAELAHHFGCLIDPARSAKPRDKPRVERQVPFVRESFWTGRSFGSLEEINTGAERWCLRVAGPRDHGTTHTPPLLLFQTIEQPAMLALPTTPFEIVTWAKAKVGRDCHAQVHNSLYSIPSRYVGQRLDVRIGVKIVRFYAGAELAKTRICTASPVSGRRIGMTTRPRRRPSSCAPRTGAANRLYVVERKTGFEPATPYLAWACNSHARGHSRT